jgi:hypothetical protein
LREPGFEYGRKQQIEQPIQHGGLPGLVLDDLIAEQDAPIMELVYREGLSRDQVYELAFIGGPLELRGADAAPIRPIAIPVKQRRRRNERCQARWKPYLPVLKRLFVLQKAGGPVFLSRMAASARYSACPLPCSYWPSPCFPPS